MAESTRLVDLVDSRITRLLDDRTAQLSGIAPELGEVVRVGRDLLSGGKRFRALFCYWGWQSVHGLVDPFDPLPADDGGDDLAPVLDACAALEVFHAAALVHDDIMDNSDRRRGGPSAHRRFESLHRNSGWSGRPAPFGRSAALLLGDLLLGWSDELLDEGLRRLPERGSALAARAEFVRMRTEVTAGQYLDILEEATWSVHDDEAQLSRAHRVIVYKAAKYSVEAPLTLGAAIGGASLDQLSALSAFGLPLGIAYQLRDDLLGVFGDPEETGKPAGDDLREGKRTVLIAHARATLPPNARRSLDELLGDPDLDAAQVATLQSTLRECGAVDQVERLIRRNVQLAQDALGEAPLTRSAREQLAALADRVTRRSS